MYFRPTHTDQYLQWDSHHDLSAKYSVIGTLTQGAKTVCTGAERLQREDTAPKGGFGQVKISQVGHTQG